MRVAALLLGIAGLAASPLTIQPAAAGPDRIVAGHASNIVQIAEGCGVGRHWVPRHQDAGRPLDPRSLRAELIRGRYPGADQSGAA